MTAREKNYNFQHRVDIKRVGGLRKKRFVLNSKVEKIVPETRAENANRFKPRKHRTCRTVAQSFTLDYPHPYHQLTNPLRRPRNITRCGAFSGRHEGFLRKKCTADDVRKRQKTRAPALAEVKGCANTKPST